MEHIKLESLQEIRVLDLEVGNGGRRQFSSRRSGKDDAKPQKCVGKPSGQTAGSGLGTVEVQQPRKQRLFGKLNGRPRSDYRKGPHDHSAERNN